MPSSQSIELWEERAPAPEELTEPESHVGDWEEEPGKLSDRIAANAKQDLEMEIRRSQQILDLEDDWDGNGSPPYAADTLNRATSFLVAHSDWLWRSHGVRIPVPTIGPGPEGSIDLYWKRTGWELLVNIPVETEKPATFSGNNYGTETSKGSFDPGKRNITIASWLIGQ